MFTKIREAMTVVGIVLGCAITLIAISRGTWGRWVSMDHVALSRMIRSD